MCHVVFIHLKSKGYKKFMRSLARQDHADWPINKPCCRHCQSLTSEPPEPYTANVVEKERPPQKTKVKGPRVIQLEDVSPDAELCTIAEACDIIGISRSTLRVDREQGYLTDIKKGSRDVRLFRDEVERLRGWYAYFKGKN